MCRKNCRLGKKYGKNYFENGYDARHAAFLEDSFNLLSSINDEYNVQKAIIITQQSWDENIGTLAGITKNGNRVQSGKVYTDFFEEGKRIESSSDEFSTQIFDPLKGNLDISDSKTSTLLKFMTPILTPEKNCGQENNLVSTSISPNYRLKV